MHMRKAHGSTGGRGRAGSNYEDRPLQPDREAAMGTAARPGKNIHLMGTEESAATVERQFAGFPKALQVRIASGAAPPAFLKHGSCSWSSNAFRC